MNKASTIKTASKHMPQAETTVRPALFRYGLPSLLDGDKNIGIELGVASGSLSLQLLQSGKFRDLFGVDIYGDIHDTREYKTALTRIGIDRNHKLLRMTFDDALSLFPDAYFDFFYIDGFAHTGEEGGRTIADWYGKLKIGGIMSGDDYHSDWPLVMWAVNHLSRQFGCSIELTESSCTDRYSMYPSWFFRKERDIPRSEIQLDERLTRLAESERRRIHRLRTSPLHRAKRAITGHLRFLTKR